MRETKRTHMSTNEYTLSRIPYTLTTGVSATRDGLTGDVERIGRLLDVTPDRETDPPIIPWLDAAERLRYREGEPWCYALRDAICTGSAKEREILDGWVVDLHRLAAILCDDAQAFRVLHWCIENLGGAHAE